MNLKELIKRTEEELIHHEGYLEMQRDELSEQENRVKEGVKIVTDYKELLIKLKTLEKGK